MAKPHKTRIRKKPNLHIPPVEAQENTPSLPVSPAGSPETPAEHYPPPEAYHQKEIKSVGQIISKLSKHFVILIFIIVLAVAMHFLLEHVFGDPKFFDYIPVRWAIDLGDIAIIFTFVIIVIRELWKVEK